MNYKSELNQLNSREYSRSKEVETLIKATRQKLLLLCNKHASHYTVDLNYITKIYLFILDSIVTEKDLKIYEDGKFDFHTFVIARKGILSLTLQKNICFNFIEIEIKIKRKTLKSLRRKRLNKGKNGDDIDNTMTKFVNGYRGVQKDWEGIPVNQLCLIGLDVDIGKLVGDAKEYFEKNPPIADGTGEEREEEEIIKNSNIFSDDEDDYVLPSDDDVMLMTDFEMIKKLIVQLMTRSLSNNKKTKQPLQPKSKKLNDLKTECIKLLATSREEYTLLLNDLKEYKRKVKERQLNKINELSPSMSSFRTHVHSCVLKGRLNGFHVSNFLRRKVFSFIFINNCNIFFFV
jgi:hypothetical protein